MLKTKKDWCVGKEMFSAENECEILFGKKSCYVWISGSYNSMFVEAQSSGTNRREYMVA